jgi:hypothetical protein
MFIRAPSTPLNAFYTLGKYPKEIEQRVNYTIGKPGLSATILERNKNTINIKPQIHGTFDASVFKPGKYLTSRKEHSEMIDNVSNAHNCT